MSEPGSAPDDEDTSERLMSLRTDETDPEALVQSFTDYLSVIARARSNGNRDPHWVWGSPEELLMSMAHPQVVRTLTLPEGIAKGEVKECFYNAFMLTLSHPHLVYTEGYAMAGFFPVNHAWCTDPETGRIIDPTWVNLDHSGPFVYWGLPFSRAFMQKALDTGEDYPSVFESDWRRRGKTTRCGLIYDKDGLIGDWGDPPPF